MKIENVVFDLDGTLLNTTEGVLESVIYAVQMMGYRELPYEKLLNFVGPPIQNSFIEYFGCTKEEAQRAADIFRDYYKERALLKAVPYEGIYELCEVLKKKGIKMGVATYKREDYALTILKHFGFDRYCISMHGADDHNILTKADIVNLCVSELGNDRENTVLVGDTSCDALGAQDAGVNFIGVTYGFGFKKNEDIMIYKNIGTARRPLDITSLLIS